MKRQFHLQDDQSNKFWTVEVDGNAMITTNGRIGAKPRETRTAFASADEAQRAADKEILAKRRKGYLEGDPSALPPYDGRLPPRFVRINHDDDHASHVGKTADGRQFFLTFPFVPTIGGKQGGNYIALYVFDEFGLLQDAHIHDERQEGLTTETAVNAFADQLLAKLGKHTFGDIRVAPFALERYGTTFGLVFDPGDEEDDEDEPSVWVTVEPGNYMAFYPPWDGDYDT